MASRNVWRNKRRTFITAASIMFAVLFSVAMISVQEGTWNHMIDSIVHYHFGYAQIHKNGYWEDKTIDNVFAPEAVQAAFTGDADIKTLVPRIESFALASYGIKTKGGLVVGIDPKSEQTLTNIRDRITDGHYLNETDEGILVAEGLAEYLYIEVGDTLVLISQGYHGINAAGKFPVRGIVHFGSPELNKSMMYIAIEKAKWFYATDSLITTIIVDPVSSENIKKTVRRVRASISDEDYEVMDYEEMMPELIQSKELDVAGGYVILLILYVIIAFGIFGTILMMIKERSYEFGILKAIGMKSYQLNIMLWLETLFIGIIGCLAGIAVAFPITYYFKVNPIRLSGEMANAYEEFGAEPVIMWSTDPAIYFNQAFVVFIIISILSLYPMLKMKKLRPVEAMRS
jgi:ABC-type lipoprotein release transport system permease subunit